MSRNILFESDVAERYGILEAVLIYNFRFWIEKNLLDADNNNDGRTWTWTKLSTLQEFFRFATEAQIRRALDHLCEDGVLLKGNYNKNQWDRTTWYAFQDESKWLKTANSAHLLKTANASANSDKSICENQQIDMLENTNRSANSSNSNKGIKDNSTDNSKKINNKPSSEDEVKKFFRDNNLCGASGDREAGKFWLHYEANGWVQGQGKGRPIKNWHAAAHHWEQNWRKFNNVPSGGSGGGTGSNLMERLIH